MPTGAQKIISSSAFYVHVYIKLWIGEIYALISSAGQKYMVWSMCGLL